MSRCHFCFSSIIWSQKTGSRVESSVAWGSDDWSLQFWKTLVPKVSIENFRALIWTKINHNLPKSRPKPPKDFPKNFMKDYVKFLDIPGILWKISEKFPTIQWKILQEFYCGHTVKLLLTNWEVHKAKYSDLSLKYRLNVGTVHNLQRWW